jgi:6-pyruvoyltetrahydropterin/6-carboxytetrahydropterin synthase
MGKKVAVIRREHFNAAHRLYNEAWNTEKNAEVFGKCSLPHYHGHNYELEIRVSGEIDPVTGFVMDLKELSDLISEKVLDRFDHKNLNLDTEEFKKLNPTAENIAVVIFDLLRPFIKKDLDLFIRLFETPRNFVEYPV